MKAGYNVSESQRYKCGECKRVYTLEAKKKGYSPQTHMLTLHMYVEGSSQCSIARILKINPQGVSNWITVYVSKLPAIPMPHKPKAAELDELYTFLKQKKQNLRLDGRRPIHTLSS